MTRRQYLWLERLGLHIFPAASFAVAVTNTANPFAVLAWYQLIGCMFAASMLILRKRGLDVAL